MKTIKEILPRAAMLLLAFTVICGVLYTALVTGAAQLLFPDKANGSIITVGDKAYGSELMAQQFTADKYMWGRIMNLDVSTYKDENGKPLLYATPSNLSPTSEEYAALVAERVEKLRAANVNMDNTAIPVDLVTCSGSGLDPHISPAAAYFQAERIAQANNIDKADVDKMIEQCTNKRFLGFLGEETVNVLKFNYMIDGVL